MEKKDLISDTNVSVLHEVLQEFDQELAMILENYIQVMGDIFHFTTEKHFDVNSRFLWTSSNDCTHYRSPPAAADVTSSCQYWQLYRSLCVFFNSVCHCADHCDVYSHSRHDLHGMHGPLLRKGRLHRDPVPVLTIKTFTGKKRSLGIKAPDQHRGRTSIHARMHAHFIILNLLFYFSKF